MLFNRKKFFDGYRRRFGGLEQPQVDALNDLLSYIEQDKYVKTTDVAGFLLGTTKHETADTFRPIHEYGGKAYFVKRYGSQTKIGKRLGNDTPEEGYFYAGKGYPQTTGEDNYEKAEDAIRKYYPEVVAEFEKRTGRKFDLTVGDQPNDDKDPQNMLDPAIAYVTMSFGSRTGMFTGKAVAGYNLRTGSGRYNSRRVINGTDKATLIAGYIAHFIDILDNAVESKTKHLAFIPTEEIEPVDSNGQIVHNKGDVPPEGDASKDPAASKDNIVIETENKMKLWDYIKAKFLALTGANIGFEIIQNWLQQWEALGLTGRIRVIFTIIFAVASLVVVGIWVYSWYKDNRDKENKENLAATLNNTPTNLVHFAPTSELQDWKDWGASVVRTTETT